MSPEDLGNKSLRRNPLIADLLHRIAFIEKAGTGIRRMRDGARELGYPEPTFAANNNYWTLSGGTYYVRHHITNRHFFMRKFVFLIHGT